MTATSSLMQASTLRGLKRLQGETFRWEGAYHGAMAEAETKATHLNVFEHFQPSVPAAWHQPNVCFVPTFTPHFSKASSNKHRQLVDHARFNELWITIAKPALLDVMQAVDLIIINDGEARMLSEDENLFGPCTCRPTNEHEHAHCEAW